VKILSISFGPEISCAYAPGYIQTFINYTLFDLSNRKPSKNSTFVSYSVCRSITFFLSSFNHGTFGEVATVVYALYAVVLS
jgi:hypothetical protein